MIAVLSASVEGRNRSESTSCSMLRLQCESPVTPIMQLYESLGLTRASNREGWFC